MRAPLATEQILEFERTFNVTRLVGFALVVVLGPLFPHIGVPFVALFAAILLAQFLFVTLLVRSGILIRRPATGRLVFAIDLLILAVGILVFSADPGWSTFVVIPLVIIAGAFRFGAVGAAAATATMSAAYVATAWFRSATYGYVTEPQRAVFHVALFVLTAFLVSTLVRELASLREVDRAKSEFLATMSHDFRSPLTVVRGVLELLGSERVGPLTDRQRELTERAERNVHRLEAFAEEVLEMARIEQGGVTLEREPADVSALLRDVVDDHRPFAAARGQTIELEAAAPFVVSIDAKRVRQILVNLLSNAIKYAPERTPITVSVSREGDDLHVRVSDRGPGVPRDERELIFERFVRGRGATDTSGSGLGLSIARSFAELHQGSLRYEDAAGGGAAFVLSLPGGGAGE